jgi:magnesium-protoporphyrin O-methyltransferase
VLVPAGRAGSVGGLPDCCDPAAYERFFDEKEAEKSVRAYRRKGLDPMAASLVRYLKSRGVQGADVLEVGGGVGAIQIELLKGGARRSVNVELSPSYEESARHLAEENGLEGQITRRFGDFVEISADLDPADIVVMNRVVCCYPFMERLVSAAAAKTGRYLAMVYPRDSWWVRLALRLQDLLGALRDDYVPAYVHPVEEIEEVATRDGLTVGHRRQGLMWLGVVVQRVA